jgi:hypothetical protein
MIRVSQHWSQRSSDGDYASRLADSETAPFTNFLKACGLFDQGWIDDLSKQTLQLSIRPAWAEANRPPCGGELAYPGVELGVGSEILVPALAEVLLPVDRIRNLEALPNCLHCVQALDDLFED